MKGLKLGLVVFAAAMLTVALGGLAYAFHSGGVAECEGCHSMHTPKPGGSFLLVGSTPSATCLTCHESAGDTGPNNYHISTPTGELSQAGGLMPKQRSPGGDFGWVKLTFTYTGGSESGDSHGHNIIAPDFGYNLDATNSQAPGGTFPSAQLACTSCHDPHGKYRRKADGTVAPTGGPIWASGSYYNATSGVAANEPKATGETVGVYRLLAGNGYSKDGITFGGVPAAKVPSTYNRTEGSTQTRTAYGDSTTGGHVTWGAWCGTCHADMHSTGTKYVHKSDNPIGSTIAGIYKSYIKSGDLSGDGINGFSSLVPFIEAQSDYTLLAPHAVNNNTVLTGPGTSDKVACFSCHRAHASGFQYMLRFDYGYEFMTKGGQYIGCDNPEIAASSRGPLQCRGRSMADWQKAYYDRPATQFATYQRVLCNKCHAKD